MWPSNRKTPSTRRSNGTAPRPVASVSDLRVSETQLLTQFMMYSNSPNEMRKRRWKRRASSDVGVSESSDILRHHSAPSALCVIARPTLFDFPGRGRVRWSTFSSSAARAKASTTASFAVAAITAADNILSSLRGGRYVLEKRAGLNVAVVGRLPIEGRRTLHRRSHPQTSAIHTIWNPYLFMLTILFGLVKNESVFDYDFGLVKNGY